MISFANAKINIGLFVTGKRTDGYHNIETVFYPVKIYDVIECIPNEHFSFETLGMTIPNAGINLCEKAFNLIKKDYDIKPVSITLLKNIPIGAGLGGGSSDAAFVLKMINQYQQLNLSNSKLKEYAEQLGADCPFFIENEPVYAYGIGTSFENIALDLSSLFIVVVKPNIHISTQEAYSSIVPSKSNIDLKEVIKLPVEDWKRYISNDFETNIFKKYSDLQELKSQLYDAGALYASMSGSGSSIYGIFEKPIQLQYLNKFGKIYYPIEL